MENKSASKPKPKPRIHSRLSKSILDVSRETEQLRQELEALSHAVLRRQKLLGGPGPRGTLSGLELASSHLCPYPIKG